MYMPIKLFSTTIIATLLVVNVFAQDVISVVISGKKMGETTITEQPSVINIKKIKYKNISAATLIIKQAMRNDAFKRSIEITDENENSFYKVNELSSKHGWFKINLATIKSTLLKQKIIKVFLDEDPANSMMRIRSSRKLLAEIHLK